MHIVFTIPKWLLWTGGIVGGIIALFLVICGIAFVAMFWDLSKHF